MVEPSGKLKNSDISKLSEEARAAWENVLGLPHTGLTAVNNENSRGFFDIFSKRINQASYGQLNEEMFTYGSHSFGPHSEQSFINFTKRRLEEEARKATEYADKVNRLRVAIAKNWK